MIQKSTSLENGPSWLGRFLFGVLVAAAYLANPFEWKHAISAELRDKYVLCNVLMYLPPLPFFFVVTLEPELGWMYLSISFRKSTPLAGSLSDHVGSKQVRT